MRAALALGFVIAAPAALAADPQREPWSMADSAYGAERMAAARAALRREHGGMVHSYFLADRLEWESDNELLADVEGSIGVDEHRFRLKAETAYALDTDTFEDASVTALYARPIAPFWDAEAGIRFDASGADSRNWAVLGVEGLAPYFFHVDAELLFSFHGEAAANIEATTDVLLTQRLILQPRMELSFAAQDIAATGIGAGLSEAELGLRLRYEIKREFAPYIGLSWSRKIGRTADFARAAGEDPGGAAFVAGLRLWF